MAQRLLPSSLVVLAAAAALAVQPGAQVISKQLKLPIVDKSIEFHGAKLYTRSVTTLKVGSLSGSFDVTARVDDWRFEHEVSGLAGGQAGKVLRRVRWTNQTIEEWRDGKPVPLDEDGKRRARDFVNARVYFSFLPYRLNDPNTFKEDLGVETWDGRKLQKIKVTFQQGSSTDADDEYMYWFDPQTGRLEQFAYNFRVGQGGLRFRKITKFERVGGILFGTVQENYAEDGKGLAVELVEPAYIKKKMKLLSTVEMTNIKVTPTS